MWEKHVSFWRKNWGNLMSSLIYQNCCCIKINQGGTVLYSHSKGKLGGGSHAVLFMVLLSLPGAKSMAQVLQLPGSHTGFGGKLPI